MKYKDIPAWLKPQVIQMEVDYYQNGVNEIAAQEGIEPWKITENSQEVIEALQNHEYELIQDRHNKAIYVERIFRH